MLAQATSAALHGIEALAVQVEVDISNGLPGLLLVGLPDTAVQESRERVRAALVNSGFPFPMRRVVVNLAPADIRKEGPAFDLPIALALLLAQGALPPRCLDATLCLGELALNGEIRPVRGAVPVGLLAGEAGLAKVIAPPGNAAEIAAVTGARVLAPRSLAETVAVLRGLAEAAPVEAPPAIRPPDRFDMAEVKGQAAAKRALEVAAAGAHNLLMRGPPGSGKTMLAARLPGLLPDLSDAEAVETTRIHSAAGLPVDGLLLRPPMRSPHHTISHAGLVGGGGPPRPGEVSLAHNGVLFLDELGELRRSVLEALRQPLEEGSVTISRARGSLTFPARVLLIASMNPCPCGFSGDATRECVCSPAMLRRYRDRISGPLLDRIDVRISVPRIPAEDLLRSPAGSSSALIRKRTATARELALERQGTTNSLLAGANLRRHCSLKGGSERFARHAIAKLGLSGRGFDRLLRVARTVADLAESERICEEHLAEAVGYREEGG